MNTVENFSKRLLDYRKTRRLTQQQMADLLNVSRNYINMMEGGREPGDKLITAFEELERIDMDRVCDDPHPAFHTPFRRPQRDTASAHLYEACSALLTTMSLAVDAQGLDSQYGALQAMLPTYYNARKSEIT